MSCILIKSQTKLLVSDYNLSHWSQQKIKWPIVRAVTFLYFFCRPIWTMCGQACAVCRWWPVRGCVTTSPCQTANCDRKRCRFCISCRRHRRQLPHRPSLRCSITMNGHLFSLSFMHPGEVKARVMLTCTNGVSANHLPVIVASDRPWTTLLTCVH